MRQDGYYLMLTLLTGPGVNFDPRGMECVITFVWRNQIMRSIVLVHNIQVYPGLLRETTKEAGDMQMIFLHSQNEML